MENHTNTTQAVKTPANHILTLTRVFRFGSINLPDPNPNLTPEEIKSLYAANYPLLEMASIGEPFVDGDELVYPFHKSEVKTKG